MIHHFMWLVTAASVFGAYLNARKLRQGFYVWAVTNACWAVYNVYLMSYAQAGLWLVYLGICVYGMFQWGGLEKHDEQG